MVITISGNPIDGFSHHGPFTDRDAAIQFAEESLNDSWWLAELHPPVEAEAPAKVNFMDELKPVSPEHAKQMMDFVTRRPTALPAGKSKYSKKFMKKLNKTRRKQGLPKIKVRDIKLKVPKGWDASSFVGNPFKGAAE